MEVAAEGLEPLHPAFATAAAEVLAAAEADQLGQQLVLAALGVLVVVVVVASCLAALVDLVAGVAGVVLPGGTGDSAAGAAAGTRQPLELEEPER